MNRMRHMYVYNVKTHRDGENNFFNNKWQLINEEITYMKIIKCNKIRELEVKVNFYTK